MGYTVIYSVAHPQSGNYVFKLRLEMRAPDTVGSREILTAYFAYPGEYDENLDSI